MGVFFPFSIVACCVRRLHFSLLLLITASLIVCLLICGELRGVDDSRYDITCLLLPL